MVIIDKCGMRGGATFCVVILYLFFGQIRQGRIQDGTKIGHRGSPSSRNFSPADGKTTATNRMHSNDLEACGKKCCYFGFHSEVKFLTRF